MLDLNKPVQTRDGRMARIICTDRVGTKYPVCALIAGQARESVCHYTATGAYYLDEGTEQDLVNVPEAPVVTERYFAVYLASPAQKSWVREYPADHAVHLDVSSKTGRPVMKVTFHDGKYVSSEILTEA